MNRRSYELEQIEKLIKEREEYLDLKQKLIEKKQIVQEILYPHRVRSHPNQRFGRRKIVTDEDKELADRFELEISEIKTKIKFIDITIALRLVEPYMEHVFDVNELIRDYL